MDGNGLSGKQKRHLDADSSCPTKNGRHDCLRICCMQDHP